MNILHFLEFSEYLPQILFGVAGIALVLFSIITLSTGARLTGVKKTLPTKHVKSSITILESLWSKTKTTAIKWLRFVGLFPEKPIYESFRHSDKWLKLNIDGEDYAYELPWYLIVGERESGKTTLLKNLSIRRPADHPAFSDSPISPSVEWRFFDKGVVLDVSGAAFLGDSLLDKYRGFEAILKNLVRFRTRRPIDGIILTIPASYFIGTAPLSEDEIFARATQVATKLRLMESKLGLKLPVYVLITKCDQIAGFSGYANSLPKNKLKEMFGWSNPYTLDELFSPQWIHTAVQNMVSYATKASLDIFEEGSVHNYQDDVMVLISELAKIETGLTKYLSTIFQSNNYREHFFLRGIYCTGNACIEEVDTKALGIEGESTIPLSNPQDMKATTPFLDDLFAKKIFLEKNLATPIKKFLIAANNHINYMKVLILVTMVGSVTLLQMGRKQLSEAVKDIYPDLIKLSRSIHYVKNYTMGANNTAGGGAQFLFQQQAENVLNLMVKAEEANLRPYFLPASLLTPIEARLVDVIRITYELIITRSMYLDLIERSNRVISYPLPALTTPDQQNEELLNPLQTSEFIVLQGYVDAMQMLERAVKVYNGLTNHQNVDDFAFLASYLYNYTLKDEFIQKSGKVVKKIMTAATYTPIKLDNYQLLAQRRLYKLYMAFIRRILDPSLNYGFAQKLQKTLDSIDNRSGDVPNIENLKVALKELQALERVVTSPDLSWIGQSAFNPGSDFETMMSQMSTVSIFGKEFIRNLSAEASEIYQRSRLDLKSYGSPITGYFLADSNTTKSLEPSAGLKSFETGLNDFLNEPFMQDTSGQSFTTTVPTGSIIYWDGQLIKMAKALVDKYQEFLRTKLSSYPIDVQESFRLRAQKQLRLNIQDILARAQKIVSTDNLLLSSTKEAYVMSQLENVTEVGEDFLNLLQYLRNSDNFELYTKIRDLVFSQFYGALENVDKLLTDQALYEPFYGKFDWWDGKEGAIFKAYDAMDHDAMRDFLDNQVVQVQKLVNTYGEPLVKYLRSGFFNLNIVETKLVEKWKRLIDQITAYSKKKANNNIMRLEHFLLEDGNKITFENCFTSLAPTSNDMAIGGYFVDKLQSIKDRMYQQCKNLASEKAIQKYATLADYFNTNLAGRFPFTSKINKAPLPAMEATPDSIKGFLDIFDGISDYEMKTLLKNKDYTNVPQIKDFLDKTRQVKVFLNTYFMPATAKGKPGLSFHVEFRANQLHEVLGNHIIDWGLGAGEQTFDTQSGRFDGRWEVGQVTAFAFKWAGDAMFRPIAADPSTPAFMNVKNRAIFMYEGLWSLLRGIMIHQASVTNGAMPNDNTLLLFKIPLSRNPQMPIAETYAQLYVRVVPQVPTIASTAPFIIPLFPTFAPVLQKKAPQ